MALPPIPPLSNITFDTYDYAIGGKMVHVSSSYSDSFIELQNQSSKEAMKMDLATRLAKFMIENQLMEFTQSKSPMGTTTVHARVYLAPDAQIKVLRLARKV